jgi:hypothetical protein
MTHETVFVPGRFYIRYPDGAFTMPMEKRLADAYAIVFQGAEVVPYGDPTPLEAAVATVENEWPRWVGKVLRIVPYLLAPFVGYFASPIVYYLFMR